MKMPKWLRTVLCELLGHAQYYNEYAGMYRCFNCDHNLEV